MEPSKKAKPIRDFLEQMGGRTTAIKANRCVAAPIGCGREIDFVTEEWDRGSIKEYEISGLCLQCQKRIFG